MGKPLTVTEEPLTATGSLLTDGNRWLSGEKSHLPEKRSRRFSAGSRLSILGKELFSRNRWQTATERRLSGKGKEHFSERKRRFQDERPLICGEKID
jgi:hypothetical protein